MGKRVGVDVGNVVHGEIVVINDRTTSMSRLIWQCCGNSDPMLPPAFIGYGGRNSADEVRRPSPPG